MYSGAISRWLVQMENPLLVLKYVLAVLAIRVVVALIAKRRRATDDAPVARRKSVLLEFLDTALIVLILIFGIVRPYLLATFYIPSESMLPTLRKDDKLIANKLVLRWRLPQRGEVIVFQPPREAMIATNPPLLFRAWLEETSASGIEAVNPEFLLHKADLLAKLPPMPTVRDDYIKRVIGVPGDHIRMVLGRGIYINSALYAEPYLPADAYKPTEWFPRSVPDPGTPPRLAKYLTGAVAADDKKRARQEFDQHFATWLQEWYRFHALYAPYVRQYVHDTDNIMLRGKSRVRYEQEFVVPPNCVFVMGDNRQPGGSFDSRYWGVVPRRDIRARAVITFWPLKRIELL